VPRRAPRRRLPEPWWAELPTEELLDVRLCDLDLELAGTALQDRVQRLYDELARKGLVFRPYVWLATDWFTPEASTGFAVPFYLAHRRLVRLEHAQMFEAEGSSHAECMKLLRHEAAHAFDNAYRLHRRADWRATFGRYSAPYRSAYRVHPTSKHFVQHLRWWYAQSHPAEDWAESFAVWLAPTSRWQHVYAGWPALKKLERLDRMVGDVADLEPFVKSTDRPQSVRSMRTTLQEGRLRPRRRLAFRPRTAPAVRRAGGDRSARAGGVVPRTRTRGPARQGLGVDRAVPLPRRPVGDGDAAALPRTRPARRAPPRAGAPRRRGAGDDGDVGARARARPEVPPMKKLRVLVLMHDEVVPPPNAAELPASATWEYEMELAILRTLGELGHEVRALGVGDELRPIRDAIAEQKPHVVFNIVSYFHDVVAYEAHVVSFLELCKQPYTGCNPRGIVLAGDKALSKQVLAWHRVPVPAFAVFPQYRRVHLPKRMQFPVIVKTTGEHGSAGIAQASVVHDDKELAERVEFLRRTLPGDVIAEQFLAGREFTVSVLGNERLETFPVWETWFDKLPAGNEPIATARVKWDPRYQERVGLRSERARDLPPAVELEIDRIARRTYRALHLSGYARIDLRMDEQGRIFVLEANVNSDLTPGEDFPASAKHAGVDYASLLQRILTAGLAYRAAWKVE
jgi:D-alanine-D-alanine ligase